MRVNNPLTLQYVESHTSEAARVLELLPVPQVAAFLAELPAASALPLVTTMLPGKLSACLEFVAEQQAVDWLGAMPPMAAAQVVRLLPASRRKPITERIPAMRWRQIRRYLKFAPATVGAMMDLAVETLPANITVADALKRLSRSRTEAGCQLFVIDDANRLVGAVSIGRLLNSNPRATLDSVLQKKTSRLSAMASVTSVVQHPAWKKHRSLPVTDRDKTLLGVLAYEKILAGEASADVLQQPRPFDNLFALAVFYWINAAQLLVGIFSVVARGQGEKS